MKTFTIGFGTEESDERKYARRVADHLGVENWTEVLDQETFLGAISELVWHIDEPINHPNSVAIWLLAKIAREKVVVLLSGEGGDELLGGYSRFSRVARLENFKRRVPGIGSIARMVPAWAGSRITDITTELSRDPDGMIIWSSAFLPPSYVQAMLGKSAVEMAESKRRSILRGAPCEPLVNRHIYYELKTYLVSLLTRVDKMSMAHGLESRVPLLDHSLVEFAGRLPVKWKMNNGTGKAIMRALLEHSFPGEYLQEAFVRPKVGFAIPHAYFRDQGLSYIRNLVNGQSFRDRGFVEHRAVRKLLDDHEFGGRNLSDAIWLLATLEIWARSYIDRAGELAT